jgi:hypothetical protein
VNIYDLYRYDPAGNIVVGWHRFEADDDDHALRISEELATHPPAEIWRDQRIVKRWDYSQE